MNLVLTERANALCSARTQKSAFRFGGLCLLLLFVLTSTSLGPGLTALLGAIDPTHHLCIGVGDQTTRVVLHHEGGGLAHHHGLIARVLTGFALAPRCTNPDHVIQFHSSDTLSKQARATASRAMACPAVVPSVTEVAIISDGERFSFFVSAFPPPTDGGLGACLRSTVLLI